MSVLSCVSNELTSFSHLFQVSSKNKVLCGVLGSLVALEFCSVMLYYSRIRKAKLFTEFSNRTTTTIEKVMNGIFILTDTSLAGSLVVLLRKNRSGFSKTDTIVRKLIRFTISTSLPTAIMAFMIFVCQQVGRLSLCRG